MSDGLCQAVAGAARYHTKRQFAQSLLPVRSLKKSVDHLEDDPIAADHQQAAPLIDISCAYELAGVISVLSNVNLIRSLRLGQNWVYPSLESLPAPAGPRLRIQQHQQLPIFARTCWNNWRFLMSFLRRNSKRKVIRCTIIQGVNFLIEICNLRTDFRFGATCFSLQKWTYQLINKSSLILSKGNLLKIFNFIFFVIYKLYFLFFIFFIRVFQKSKIINNLIEFYIQDVHRKYRQKVW